MRILVLGGTGFIGSHLTQMFVAAGHQVSVLARGQTKVDLPAGVELLNGDRDQPDGLDALNSNTWEACVDVSGYLPGHVQSSGERLQDVIRRYVFISAVAAYGDPPGPVTENTPTPRLTPAEQTAVQSLDDLDNRTYGPSKVTCEDVLHSLYGERLTVLRPQVVTGPGDPTTRYTPWLARAATHQQVLFPGNGEDFLQVIDVRDLARFALHILEHDLPGLFNVVGPRLTWAEFAQVLGVTKPVWAELSQLEAEGVPLSDFPLYRPSGSVRSGLMNVSSAKAQAAGLSLTPPEVTARHTLSSLNANQLEELGELPAATQKFLASASGT